MLRELRERTIQGRTLWIRPAILAVLTVLLVVSSAALPHVNLWIVGLSVVTGAVLGAITGFLVARSTTFRPAGQPGAVLAKGSIVTVLIWVVALTLRLVARFALVDAGGDRAAQFELNTGLIALITAAFVVVALEFRRAIGRYAPGSATASRTL